MITDLPAQLATFTPQDVTGAAATDVFSDTGHGLAAGDSIVFTEKTGGAGVTADSATPYYVIASGLTADAFKVSTTRGGSTIDLTTDMTAGKYKKVTNWANMADLFTPEDRGRLAGWYETKFGGTDLTDASVFLDQTNLQNFYLHRRLTDPNPAGPR